MELLSTPILHFPDMNIPFNIDMNSTQFVIGDVIKQGGHPVAYHSGTLSEGKFNHNTYDKTFLQIGACIKGVAPLYSLKRDDYAQSSSSPDLY